jgi:catechol 2,3-dioxygenase
MTSARPIDPATRIGHVHLNVADRERTLGFEVTPPMGSEAVFLSAGAYHHVGLNTCGSRAFAQLPQPRGGGRL